MCRDDEFVRGIGEDRRRRRRRRLICECREVRGIREECDFEDVRGVCDREDFCRF